MPRVKQEKTVRKQPKKKTTSEKPTPAQTEPILPSVELSDSPVRQPTPSRRATLGSQAASPFHSATSAKRSLDATSETHAGGPAPKVPKVNRDISRPAAPTRNATTQTKTEDTSSRTRNATTQTEIEHNGRWTRDLAGNLVEPFKQAFAEVVAVQTKTLTEMLPATVKAAVQQLLANEAANPQSNAVLVRPQVSRSVAPETALARQAYATYADPIPGHSQIVGMVNLPYEHVRQVSRSDVRSLAGERLVEMNPYVFHRGSEQRRY